VSNIKQKAVNTAVDALEAFRGKQFTGALEVIEALDAAGLLRTGREQEVMCRLTTTAMGSDLWANAWASGPNS
jgi:hypothetical protein